MPTDLSSVQLRTVNSIEDAEEFFRWLGQSRNILGLDTETKGLDYWRHGTDFVRLVQFGDLSAGWTISAHRWRGVIEKALDAYVGSIDFHNLSFDWKALKQSQFSLPARHMVHDTMLLDALINPSRRHGLKAISVEDISPDAGLGAEMLALSMKNGGWDWTNIPEESPAYSKYSSLDPVLNAYEWEYLYPQLGDMQEAYKTELSFAISMAECEFRGVNIDQKYVNSLLDIWDKDLKELRISLAINGVNNPNSRFEIIDSLETEGWNALEFTASGSPKVSKDVLEKLQLDYKTAELLLSYRGKTKRISSYLRKFQDVDASGRLHFGTNTLVARTHRSSISNPPLQQLPKTYTIRRAILPSDGHKLGAVDYDAQELRLIAALSDEIAIQDILASGRDIHRHTAAAIYGIEYDSINKDDKRRQLSKAASYAIAYGAKPKKIMQTANVTYEEAESFYNQFNLLYPNITAWRNKAIYEAEQEAKSKGYALAPLPENRKALVHANKIYTTRINTEVQGTGAVVLKQAVNRLVKAGMEDYIMFPVHDEVVFSLPEQDADSLLKEAAEIMEDFSFNVPLTTQASALVESWGGLYENTRTNADIR